MSHIIVTALLFLLRILYFPSVGAHHLKNPLMRICLAVKEPTQYLQSQHDFSLMVLGKGYVDNDIFEFLEGYLAALGTGTSLFFRELGIKYPGYTPYAYRSEQALIGFTTFMYLCSLQRYVISVLYLLCTIVIGGYVINGKRTPFCKRKHIALCIIALT